MTKLSKPLRRETNQEYQRRKIVLALYPGSASRSDLIVMRLKGTRHSVCASVDDVYRTLCSWNANKLFNAKKAARKNGIPWKQARKTFERNQMKV